MGRGGLANFEMQHRPGISKACQLALKKKNKADTHQRSQPRLQAFFTKRATPLVPTMVPIARCVIAYAIEPASTGPHAAAERGDQCRAPNVHVNNILSKLERAIETIPGRLPDATEADEIAVFCQDIPTNMDQDDAWESVLDPLLNRFLGFGRSLESIAAALRGGQRGLQSMARYIREFVSRYDIDAGLLEGKMERLIQAIEML